MGDSRGEFPLGPLWRSLRLTELIKQHLGLGPQTFQTLKRNHIGHPKPSKFLRGAALGTPNLPNS